MKIEIEISQYLHDVLAHNQPDVGEHIHSLATREANNEAKRLADREIAKALNDPKTKSKMTMDRETIVRNMLAAPGYKNAAGRRAVQEKAQADLKKAQADQEKAQEAARGE